MHEHKGGNPTQILVKWILHFIKKDNTSWLSWVYSRNIRLNFRKSVIIIHYISILKEQSNMVMSLDEQNTFHETPNTYL